MDGSQREGAIAIVGAVLVLASVVVPVAGLGTAGATLQDDPVEDPEIDDAVDDTVATLVPPDDVVAEADANFTVSHVALPDVAARNETIGLQATVTNAGNETANQTVGYHFEGETLWSEPVELDPGESFLLLPTEPDDEPEDPHEVAQPLVAESAVQNATADGETVEEATYDHGVYTPQDVENDTVDLRTESTVVSGVVYDRETNESVGNASVTIAPDRDDAAAAEATTATNGSFVADSVAAPANYTIAIDHDAYASAEWTTPTEEIELAPVPAGWPVGDFFALDPLGAVNGTVTDSDDEPIAGANVSLARGGNVTASTATDAAGDYEFESVAPGSYELTANHSDYAEGNQSVTVQPGETATRDVDLKTPPTYVVEDATLPDWVAAGENYTVSATIRNEGDQAGNREVRYTLDGEYVVQRWIPIAGENATATVEFEIGGDNVTEASLYDHGVETLDDRESATLDVIADGSVRGTIASNRSGDALEGVEVVLQDDGTAVARNETDAAGTYAFDDVEAGEYTLVADAEHYAENGTNVSVAAAERTTADLELAPEPGAIDVTVTDAGSGDPIEGATVTVSEAVGALPPTEFEGDTNASGSVRAGDLETEANYTVTVEANDYHRHETTVSLGAGETAPLDVALDPVVEFAVADVSASAEAVLGEEVTIEAVIENPTTVAAEQDVRLLVLADDESEVVYEEEFVDLSIDAGDTRSLATTWNTAGDDPGNYSLGVDLEGSDHVQAFELLSDEGDVEGTVSTPDGPLADVDVRLIAEDGGDEETAATDADGEFQFESVSAGDYEVEVDPAEYHFANETVTVDPGETASVALNTTPLPGTVSGQVFGSTGDPISGATVSIDADGVAEETDANGRYAFQDLEPGTYTVVADAPDYDDEQTAVTVDAGEQATANFELEPEPGAIDVTVTDVGSGDPIEGATVTVSEPGGVAQTVFEDETDAAGTVAADDLEAETDYVVEVEAEDYHTEETTVALDAGEVASLDLALDPVVEFAVADLSVPDEVVAGESVRLEADVENPSTVRARGPARLEVRQGSDLHHEEELNLTLPAGESALFETTWFSDEDDVGSYTVGALTDGDQVSHSLDVVAAEGDVEGTLTAPDDPLADVDVRLIAQEDGENETTETDAAGEFRFESVPAGEYEVRAEPADYHVANEMVDVEPLQTASVNLTTTELPGTVAGEVTDDDGEPISGVRVALDDEDVEAAETDRNGTYAIEGVDPGTYDVSFARGGYQNESATVTVDANRTAIVDATLSFEEAGIEGTVLDEVAGWGVPNATVTVTRDGQAFENVTTSENGHFFVSLDPSGENITLSVDAADHNSTTVTDFDVTPGGITDVGDVELDPQPALVGGFVTNNVTGEPMGGIPVSVLDTTGEGEHYYDTTNGEGEFTHEEVVPGEYQISATTADFEPVIIRFTVRAGEVHGFPIFFQPRDGTVEGQVRSSDGEPVAGAELHIDVEGLENQTTGPDGTYAFEDVPAQIQHEITVVAEDYHTAIEDVELEPKGHEDEGDVVLDPLPGAVDGVVTNESGAPIEGATVAVDANGTEPARTDGNGTYLLDGVPAEVEHELSVTAPDHTVHEDELRIDANGVTTRDATLSLTNASVVNASVPDSVDAGDQFTVAANVTSEADEPMVAGVDLLVDGSAVATETVRLADRNATEQATFSHVIEEEGNHDVDVAARNGTVSATIDVQDDSGGGIPIAPPDDDDDDDEDDTTSTTPRDSAEPDLSVLSANVATEAVDAGEEVRVDVTVQNLGDAEGEVDLELTANGSTVDTATVDVPSGRNVGTSLSATFDEPGTYALVVEDAEAGTVDVLGEDGTTGVDDAAPGSGGSSDGGDSIPGFGLVAGALALVLGSLVAARGR